jgi:hypothetical protein
LKSTATTLGCPSRGGAASAEDEASGVTAR